MLATPTKFFSQTCEILFKFKCNNVVMLQPQLCLLSCLGWGGEGGNKQYQSLIQQYPQSSQFLLCSSLYISVCEKRQNEIQMCTTFNINQFYSVHSVLLSFCLTCINQYYAYRLKTKKPMEQYVIMSFDFRSGQDLSVRVR